MNTIRSYSMGLTIGALLLWAVGIVEPNIVVWCTVNLIVVTVITLVYESTYEDYKKRKL